MPGQKSYKRTGSLSIRNATTNTEINHTTIGTHKGDYEDA